MKTRSEVRFESFCDQYRIRHSPIPRGSHPTADYEIWPAGTRVVAEVKQLEPNEEERAKLREGRLTGSAAMWYDSEARIRKRIDESRSQFRTSCDATTPTILVIFDSGTFGGFGPDDVKNAMHGDECVTVERFADGSTSVHPRSGQNRACRPSHNQHLSAVGILVGSVGSVRLHLYHNVFARIPLPSNCFSFDEIEQFIADIPNDGSWPAWRPYDDAGRSVGEI